MMQARNLGTEVVFPSRPSETSEVAKLVPPIATPDLVSLQAAAKAAGLRYVNDRKPA